MEISVIIPTKDRLEYLKKVLPSFLMQDEVKEIIVVIDGSTDGTLEYLKNFCQNNTNVHYLDNVINRGIPFTKNRGIDSAKYEYIFMAEDDLELTKDFFKILSNHMEKTNADIMCGRNIFRRDTETGEESIHRTDMLKGSYVNMKTIELETSMNIQQDKEEPIIAAPMLAKASIFRNVKFDEIYKVNFWREETDFQLSAREQGYKLFCCPHAICFNFVITNDRGGVHSATGLRREKWVIINNWLFIKKHDKFIKDNFDIGNKEIYIVKFSINRVLKNIIFDRVIYNLSNLKHYLLKIFS